MPNVSVTIRQVKNSTGLDLLVPSYSEKTQLFRSVVEYNVVAVSNLACFKQRKHNDSDVVQLTVTKKLEDFDDLRKKLGSRFHGTLFPPLPQTLFSVVEGTAKKQVTILEAFLQFIAESPRMATSVELLRFLGLSTVNAGKVRMPKSQAARDRVLEEEDDRPDNSTDMFETTSSHGSSDDEGLFTSTSQEIENSATAQSVPRLFTEQDFGSAVAMDDDLVLFGAVDVDSSKQKGALLFEDQKEDELLLLDGNLDDLLDVSSLAEKMKTTLGAEHQKSDTELPENPKIATKPLASKPVALKPAAVKPDITSPKPKITVPKPDVTSPKPSLPKPDITSPKPSLPKPDITSPKPSLPKPKITAPKPTSSKPDVTAPKPNFKVPKPNSAVPKPSATPGSTHRRDGADSTVRSTDVRENDRAHVTDISSDSILKYIQDNSNNADDDLDLFS